MTTIKKTATVIITTDDNIIDINNNNHGSNNSNVYNRRIYIDDYIDLAPKNNRAAKVEVLGVTSTGVQKIDGRYISLPF